MKRKNIIPSRRLMITPIPRIRRLITLLCPGMQNEKGFDKISLCRIAVRNPMKMLIKR